MAPDNGGYHTTHCHNWVFALPSPQLFPHPRGTIRRTLVWRGKPRGTMKQSHTTTVGNETAPASRLPLETGKAVLVGVAYYATAWLSLRVALVGHQVTPIWPPTGIALVGLLLFGRRVWPGITLAAFLVNAPIGPTLPAAAVIAIGNTLAPLAAVTLLEAVGFERELDRLRDAIGLVFLGAILSMAVSATIGTATLVLSGALPAPDFWPTWSVWWAGDAMGILIVAPFLLSLLRVRVHTAFPWRRRAEVVMPSL